MKMAARGQRGDQSAAAVTYANSHLYLTYNVGAFNQNASDSSKVLRFSTAADNGPTQDFSLSVGAAIRIIREPYFGLLATVSALPTALTTIDSGAEVRVLEAQLVSTGQSVTVPRANVEIVAG